MMLRLPFALLLSLLVLPTQNLIAQDNGPGGDRRGGRANGRHVTTTPRADFNPDRCNRLEYQSLDGTCNNLSRDLAMEFGATDIVMQRIMEAEYGASDSFNALGGEGRKSAREISNLVVQQKGTIPSQQGLSAMVFSWGQFIDHDITLILEAEDEEANIFVPTDDPVFTVDIPFHRSEYFNLRGDGLPREQMNVLTAWIDGSMVYGSSEERADWLRTGVDGRLKSSGGNMLPFNTVDGEFSSAIDPDAPSTAGGDESTKMWVAGDVRAGEQIGLTSLHTVFLREHNRIADQLIAEGFRNDEEIYQAARRQVVAIIQKITFEDFLPALGVDLGRYRGYDEDVNPNIMNEFATAGYRLGHTMVVDSVEVLNASCEALFENPVSLREAFFNTSFIREHDVDPFLRGLSFEVQEEVDPYIVPELRDFLFTPPDSPVAAGLDLAALNIQRGRDHGLPDYNSIRAYYLGSAVQRFEDISSESVIQDDLREAYDGDVNNIDAWVGLLSEDLESDASMGPTLLAILSDQFGRLRDGDRYYYEALLSGSELNDVRNTSLADVIERNTDIEDMSSDLMHAQSCGVSTGIENPTDFSSSLDVYPNPTTGILRYQNTDGLDSFDSYSVLDVNGRVVIGNRATESLIDLRPFPPGIYLLKFESVNGFAVKKIVLTE